jgi:hypothetical protein
VTLFARNYQQHIIPRLQRLAVAEAFCVVNGVEDWTGAFDSLMAYARTYGALYLPDNEFHDLDDWLSTTLLAEIVRQEAAREAAADATA